MNKDELVVELIIIKRYHGEVDVLGVLKVDGAKLEHVHRCEAVEIEVGDVGIIHQRLLVSLEVKHLGAIEGIRSDGVNLIGQHRVDTDVGTILEVNTQEILGVGFFGEFTTEIEQ